MGSSNLDEEEVRVKARIFGKSGKEKVHIVVCGGPYIEVTEDVEDWIFCDKCETWFHWVCAEVIEEPESFLCKTCK